jgi:hypothetical protein
VLIRVFIILSLFVFLGPFRGYIWLCNPWANPKQIIPYTSQFNKLLI